MSDHDFQPEWMSAPGATIAEILRERRLTPAKFAEIADISQERVRRLLSGREAITIEIAEVLESTIGGSSRFWMAREEQYRGDVARLLDAGSKDAGSVWLSELPIKDMIKLGWISAGSSAEQRISACLDFFGVPDVRSWRERYSDIVSAVSFRTSPTHESQPGSVIAWLRYGEIKSSQVECQRWDRDKFEQTLKSVRRLTREKDPKEFVPELKKKCAECGVVLVVARAPAGCRASGATRFIEPTKAMILLSFRHLSDDQFWFTFFHEAAHLVFHSDRALFLEDGSDVTLNEEDEANQFAQDFLVPPQFRDELDELPLAKRSIARFAKKIGVSPGIVVGQLQHMERLRPSQLNWMKRRFSRDQIDQWSAAK